ncbi:MAG: transporter substrate-binding domain-containing protein [Spirochaetes bacterium]|nr:transporter substrate-binding domain-containing protein [Spirochaetota bacterium]
MKHCHVAIALILLVLPFEAGSGNESVIASGTRLPVGTGQPTRVLSVGIDRNAAPMEFEKEGSPAGFNVDIIKAVAAEAGFDVRFYFLPWTEVIESVRNGRLDIMFALDTPERHRDFSFSTPILHITWRIFVNENTYGISSLDQIQNHTVAVVKGFASHAHLVEKHPEIHIRAVDTVPDALELLARGEVFAFFGQYHLARYYLQTKKYRNIKVIGNVVDVTPFAIAVQRDNTGLLKIMNEALAAIQMRGEYRTIYEKWYGGDVIRPPITLKKIMPFLLGLMGAIVALGLWSYTLRRKVRQKTSELSENLAKFKRFTEKAPFPVVIAAADGTFEYVNPRFTEAYGYTLSDIPDTDTWFTTMYPDREYRNSIIEKWNVLLLEKRDIQDSPEVYTLINKFGESMSVAFRVLNIEEGRVIVVMEDITAQRALENERLRKEQIESISLLAGGIAHDFNNILMNLLGYINLMQLEPGQSAGQKDMLEKMAQSVQRATGITGQLMTFSKGGTPVKKSQSIEPLILESMNFVLHGSNCLGETDFQPDLPPIDIDAAQIYQTLTNLFINARQAMPDGGSIRVRADTVDLGPGRAGDVVAATLPPGTYLRIKISDSGTGISPEDRERIFTPYYSTKERGTGLGLATAYSIVIKHRGTIDFKSEPGKGTTFTIHLPYSGTKAVTPDVKPETPVKRYSMKAIIMDDEESILDILEAMLARLGFTVARVENGDDLIREYIDAAERGKKFDLVISDLTIPGGKGGGDAANELRKFDPDARIIVSSGYSPDEVLSNYREFGFSGVLKKPYTFDDLRRMIDDIAGK